LASCQKFTLEVFHQLPGPMARHEFAAKPSANIVSNADILDLD